MKKKKLRELLNEQRYSIEALEDEIENLEERLREEHEKLWEIIQENDRLTMTYEPYRPPGDEHEKLDFYGLIEENTELRAEVAGLKIQLWVKNQPPIESIKKPKEKKAGIISLDFWPPSDWFRLSHHKWNPGKAAQLCIGPFRIDWMAA